jgi:transposase InsO family protein
MFVLVATYYFTKWMEAMPLRNMMHRELISFVQEHIVNRFGLPQTLTMDQGASFMSHQLKVFTRSLKIKLLNSSAYYVQANGQTRSSNKTLIRLIKKIIEDCPRRWHDVLLEALWARTSKHSATKVTPVELVYGQGAVLSAEINLQVHRVIKPDTLSVEDYTKLMMEKIDEMPEG